MTVSEYVKDQFWKALKTLPWYVGIPGVMAGLPLLVLAMFDEPKSYPAYWMLFGFAIGSGAFVWLMRQSVRILWTVRTLTR